MSSPISNIAKYIYGAGVLTHAGICIHSENINLEKRKQQGDKVDFYEYAFVTYIGASMGCITGLMWPATVFGRITTFIVPK